MKVVIADKIYTEIKNLKFNLQADITGSKVAINEFTVAIKTLDVIGFGDFAYLYDDKDRLWAKYWITEVERQNEDFVYITAQSLLLLMDRATMPAKYYDGVSVGTVLAEIFGYVPQIESVIDVSFGDRTITGFCKEQSARERLQNVCFVIRAYVKTYFTDKVEILPVDETTSYVPANKTFATPSVKYGNFTSAVQVTAYTYTEGTPQSTDKWVSADNTTYYIQTTQSTVLRNTDVPETVPENVVTFDKCTLVNPQNVSEIISRLAKYYFKRLETTAEIVDGGEYLPAQNLTVNSGVGKELLTGFVSSCSFTFGHSSKAKITIAQSDTVTGVTLNLVYEYDGQKIGGGSYLFPAGYVYSIQNPYIDAVSGGHRFIYRPINTAATGTLGASDTDDTEEYAVALDYSNRVLEIISVDSATQTDKEVKIK